MKNSISFLKSSLFFIILISCSNNSVQRGKLKSLQGRYLFLEYNFKSNIEGEDYSVSAIGNKTYWILRNDSILEEYFTKKNNEVFFDYDLIDQIEYVNGDQFKLYDTLVSSIKLNKDTLVIENKLFKYKLIKEY